jgi:hypothetical protein
MFIVNVFLIVRDTGDLSVIVPAALFYTAMTTAGSTASQWILLRFAERGKRRVGAR